ncbi:DNA polymerase alpha/epsilon subunit B-domain-containing protein [Suillus bovinus]|uniref:DNA polymerase alpha/epsilon subunit B-domain-containing protein n=1 Tax=Suillus bovinus TaxID=48563 RepID=UPI001B85C7D7|nr:DNA polymerase alpha/epsilon subunit B-domain-containing protein [Suillus bovinus]KAG2153032.1 DNA polymerase alpha/epsilon subunit B-domain-containing protein [Suillus bovinus]
MSSLRSDVCEWLGAADSEEHLGLINECVTICQMYNLTAKDLQYKWEALSYGKAQRILRFTCESAADMKAQIQREIQAKNASNMSKSTATGPVRGRLANSAKFVGVNAKGLTGPLKAAAQPPKALFGGMAIVPVKLEQDFDGPIASSSRVTFVGQKEARKNRAYRYMYETLGERSDTLDAQLDGFGELVLKHYQDVGQLGHPGVFSEESCVVVGRIVIDADASGPGVKLNDQSLILESSRSHGDGLRVPLQLAQDLKIRGGYKGLGGVGLFPGAVVALKGRNGGGGYFIASEIMAIPPMPASPTPPSNAAASFDMCIACGPFTPDANLDYKPWRSLIVHLKASKPAVVLLLGPFVDATHAHIHDGIVDETPSDIFKHQFIVPLRDFLSQSPTSTVLLVPSVNDIVSDHAVFPQCELDDEFCGDPRIRLLPNPARFSLNGICFAVCSVDVLYHLRKEEYFRRGEEVDSIVCEPGAASDPMSNLSRYILQQRSFYPIFPVPLDVAHEVNLDVSHSAELRVAESPDDPGPDVLVLPSRLKHFSKVVDSSVVVNPSYLTKGTYTTLSYSGQGTGFPKDRISADIARLS